MSQHPDGIRPRPAARDVQGYGAVGDGRADDTIAFARALEIGSFVHVPPGTYRVGEVPVDGATLAGSGTIKKISTAPCALRLQGRGARVEGLTFNSSGADGQPNSEITLGEGARDAVISGCRFVTRNHLYSAISAAVESSVGGSPYATPVSGVLISDNVFSGRYSRPIYLHSVRNATISGNLFRDCVYDAIRLREHCGPTIICGNQFVHIGDPSWPDHETRDAVDAFWGGGDLVLSHNIVDQTAYHGFDLKLTSPDGRSGARRLVVTGNQIRGCRRSGIVLRGSPHAKAYNENIIVQSNIIADCNRENATGGGESHIGAIQADGLLRYVSIESNHLVGNHGRGLVVTNVFPGVPASYAVTIRGNFLVNNGCPRRRDGQGLRVSGVGDCLILANNVRNDPELPNAGSQTQGIVYFTSSSASTGPARKSVILRDNISRGHLGGDLVVEPVSPRTDAVAVQADNLTGP